ncbi:hypothetical protein HK102_010439 [Quaeritorhiza haematococci]|nr:hypothetical protein HK102_010439 [Quaeritorhiza haematococci]
MGGNTSVIKISRLGLALFILSLRFLLSSTVYAVAVHHCTRYAPADNPAILTSPSGRLDSQVIPNALSNIADTTYQVSAECAWIISPTEVANNNVPFVLNFISFEMEDEYDWVYIYNGTKPDLEGATNLLASLTGHAEVKLYFNNDTEGKYTFPNVQSVTVRFVSDGALQYDGFTAIYYVPSVETPSFCVNNCTGNGVCDDGVCRCNLGFEGGDCRRDDVFILRTIAQSCNFDRWTRCSQSWIFTPETTVSDLESWSCLSTYNERLYSIELRDSNLDCIDPETGASRLAGLRRYPKHSASINLNNNRLGSIPSALYLSPRLVDVHFRNISLSGKLPDGSVTLATQLINLDLSENALNGTLDPLFRRLTQLAILNLTNNALGGFLVNDFQYLQAGSLLLAGNRFWCPAPDWESIGTVDCVNIILHSSSIHFGTATGGYNISLSGTNFPLDIPIECTFDGLVSPNTVVLSPTEIVCTVPASAPRDAFLTLTREGAQASMNSLPFSFTVSCPPGTYAIDWSTCKLCPDGAICNGGLSVPFPKDNYVRSMVNPLTFIPCFGKRTCIGEILRSKEGDGSGVSSRGIMNTRNISTYFATHTWEPVCEEGYEGPQCAACQPGWYSSGHYSCDQCSGNVSSTRAFLIIGVGFIICVVMFRIAAFISRYSTTFILLSAVQFPGLFYKYSYHWQSTLNGVLAVFGLFELNIEELGLECAFQITFYSKFNLLLMMPIWITSGFNMFLCAKNVDRSYLIPRPDVTCGTPEYDAAIPKAAGIIAMYGFGIPLVFLLTTVFLSYRNILYDEDIREMFGPIYSHYRVATHYWETVKLLLHLLLLAAPFLLNSNLYGVTFVVTIVLLIYSCLIIYFDPYRFARTNVMTLVGFSSLPIMLTTGLVQESIYLDAMGRSTTDYSTTSAAVSWAIMVYHFSCLGILIHGLLYEIQYVDYQVWIKNPTLKKILESKAFLWFFPDHGDEATVEYIHFRRRSDPKTSKASFGRIKSGMEDTKPGKFTISAKDSVVIEKTVPLLETEKGSSLPAKASSDVPMHMEAIPPPSQDRGSVACGNTKQAESRNRSVSVHGVETV